MGSPALQACITVKIKSLGEFNGEDLIPKFYAGCGMAVLW